ncbi:MAG: amidohydrolase [Actinobacteria bacterium]|nr:amidohydrolase [Actinomycetota bacterium]
MIDFHTYPAQIAELIDTDPDLPQAIADVFGLYIGAQPLATYVGHLDEAGIDQAVVLPLDCTTAHHATVFNNQQIAWLMERCERVIGFASVDPSSPGAAERLVKDVGEYGLHGLALDPALQRFDLADRDVAYPVYQAASELAIPVMVRCGINWAPKGLASLGRPLLLEPVIHDFPDLRLVIPQLGWPWVDDALMLAIKHRNVYLDTSVLFSGTPTESLRQVVETRIGHETIDRSLPRQVVFGSSYPRVDPKRAAWAVSELGFRPKLTQRIFHDNAADLLGKGCN